MSTKTWSQVPNTVCPWQLPHDKCFPAGQPQCQHTPFALSHHRVLYILVSLYSKSYHGFQDPTLLFLNITMSTKTLEEVVVFLKGIRSPCFMTKIMYFSLPLVYSEMQIRNGTMHKIALLGFQVTVIIFHALSSFQINHVTSSSKI